MITIRQGRSEELDALQGVLEACGMCGQISADNCLVTFEDESPIGLVRLEFGNGKPYVRPIAILPAHQGKGIGTSLLRTAIATYPEVRVVARGQVTEFYRNLGFQRVTWDEIYPPFRQDCEQCS